MPKKLKDAIFRLLPNGRMNRWNCIHAKDVSSDEYEIAKCNLSGKVCNRPCWFRYTEEAVKNF